MIHDVTTGGTHARETVARDAPGAGGGRAMAVRTENGKTVEMERRDAARKRDNARVLREQAADLGKRAHDLYQRADREDEEAAAIERRLARRAGGGAPREVVEGEA